MSAEDIRPLPITGYASNADQAQLPLASTQATQYASAVATALRAAARRSRAPAVITSGGGGFKARRGDRLFFRGVILSFLLIVALPFVAASIYLPFFAADQYASEARFTVRSGNSSPISGLASLGGGLGTRQEQDSQIIASYLKSRAVIDELEKTFDLKSIFAPRGFDYLFGYAGKDAKERLVNYWDRQTTIILDRSTGIISVQVRAFDPRDALALCQALIDISERMVNELTERSRKEALSFAQTELKRSEQRLADAMNKLRSVRDSEGVLNVEAQALAVNEVLSSLRLALARIEQDISASQPQLSPDAPQLRYMQNQAKALRAKIDEYSRMIAGKKQSENDPSLTASATVLDREQLEVKIAQEQYATSLASFEVARADLLTQSAFLLTFLKPSLSEDAEFPRRWMLWCIAVIPALILWAFGFGIALLIRDNMPS